MSILDKARRVQESLSHRQKDPSEEAQAPVRLYDINDRNDQTPILTEPSGQHQGSDQSPPAGARLFFYDQAGRPCLPQDAYAWTWERGPRWFHTAERPVPSCGPALAPRSKVCCKTCTVRSLRLSWQATKDGKRQLRCDCQQCGGFVKYIKPDPWVNADLEFRTAG
jgi:hypothetical protein